MAFPTRQLSAEDVVEPKATESSIKSIPYATGNRYRSFLQGLSPTAVIESVREDTVRESPNSSGRPTSSNLTPQRIARPRFDLANHVLASFQGSPTGLWHRCRQSDRPEAVDGVLTIRNWVMSCRVFSRRLEFSRSNCFRKGRARSISPVALEYRASGRNGLVGELLPKLGFERGMSEEEFSRRQQISKIRRRIISSVSVLAPKRGEFVISNEWNSMDQILNALQTCFRTSSTTI